MERFKDLINGKFNYKGKNLFIQNAKKVGNNIVVITNVQSYNLLENEVEEFIENLLPYKEKEIKVSEIESFNIHSVLIEAIERVKNDKEYIQQANAICNITSQLINIRKLELK